MSNPRFEFYISKKNTKLINFLEQANSRGEKSKVIVDALESYINKKDYDIEESLSKSEYIKILIDTKDKFKNITYKLNQDMDKGLIDQQFVNDVHFALTCCIADIENGYIPKEIQSLAKQIKSQRDSNNRLKINRIKGLISKENNRIDHIKNYHKKNICNPTPVIGMTNIDDYELVDEDDDTNK